MLKRLASLGLLHAIHPDLTWDDWLDDRFELLSLEDPVQTDEDQHVNPENRTELQTRRRQLAYCVWLLRLASDKIDAVCERLHYPRNQIIQIRASSELWRKLPEFLTLLPSQIVTRLDEVHPIAISACRHAAKGTEAERILSSYLSEWRNIRANYSGIDLRKRGIPPGPVYKQILFNLRSAWLNGQVHSVDEESELFNCLVDEALQALQAS